MTSIVVIPVRDYPAAKSHQPWLGSRAMVACGFGRLTENLRTWFGVWFGE